MATLQVITDEDFSGVYVFNDGGSRVGVVGFDSDTDIDKATAHLVRLIELADNPPVAPVRPTPLTEAQVQAIVDGLPTGKR